MRIISQDQENDYPYESVVLMWDERFVSVTPVGQEHKAMYIAGYAKAEDVKRVVARLHNAYNAGAKIFTMPQQDDL